MVWSRGSRLHYRQYMITLLTIITLILFVTILSSSHPLQNSKWQHVFESSKTRISPTSNDTGNTKAKLSKESFLVGPLPWDEGENPLTNFYSGQIEVRNNSNGWSSESQVQNGTAGIFFFFSPALSPKEENPPLIIFFQGGPGSSSLIG